MFLFVCENPYDKFDATLIRLKTNNNKTILSTKQTFD